MQTDLTQMSVQEMIDGVALGECDVCEATDELELRLTELRERAEKAEAEAKNARDLANKLRGGTVELHKAARYLRVPARWLEREIVEGRLPGLRMYWQSRVHVPTLAAALDKRAMTNRYRDEAMAARERNRYDGTYGSKCWSALQFSDADGVYRRIRSANEQAEKQEVKG